MHRYLLVKLVSFNHLVKFDCELMTGTIKPDAVSHVLDKTMTPSVQDNVHSVYTGIFEYDELDLDLLPGRRWIFVCIRYGVSYDSGDCGYGSGPRRERES